MKPNNARTKKVTEGPPGWMVESRPRTNEKYLGKIDWAHNPNMEFANMKDKTRRFNVGKMPDSVTWVLTDTEYNKWTTYIEDEMVLEDEQILWAETFEFAMVLTCVHSHEYRTDYSLLFAFEHVSIDLWVI
ncbi:hypothetical protein TEA_027553 [Camellia sinensis var. sinensis]|uniref:Uncharacterized protein n=1 Tax=Camellia sinensis var. sinensis TaxID=542762 RepID=A0A4S4D3N0_CAMSN|nr:hypothetical protein TEA_027553 [Camellia sinensis var. sinensis]